MALVVPHKPLAHAAKEYTKYFSAQGYPSAPEDSDSPWVIQLGHKGNIHSVKNHTVVWKVLLYMCCFYWSVKKLLLAHGLTEYSQAGRDIYI